MLRTLCTILIIRPPILCRSTNRQTDIHELIAKYSGKEIDERTAKWRYGKGFSQEIADAGNDCFTEGIPFCIQVFPFTNRSMDGEGRDETLVAVSERKVHRTTPFPQASKTNWVQVLYEWQLLQQHENWERMKRVSRVVVVSGSSAHDYEHSCRRF